MKVCILFFAIAMCLWTAVGAKPAPGTSSAPWDDKDSNIIIIIGGDLVDVNRLDQARGDRHIDRDHGDGDRVLGDKIIDLDREVRYRDDGDHGDRDGHIYKSSRSLDIEDKDHSSLRCCGRRDGH